MRKPLFWQKVLGIYLIWRIWLLGLTVLSFWLVAVRPHALEVGYLAAAEFAGSLPRWVTSWGNFDGVVFMRIAQGGYGVPEVPFFPLLPLLMQPLSWLGVPYLVAGLLISLVSFLGALWFMRELWQQDRPKVSFFWLLAVLLSFPTAYYYAAVYQDALFLMLATGSLWAARQRRWVGAVVLAMLATLARLNGLALFFMLFTEYLLDVRPRLTQRWDVRRIWKGVLVAIRPRSWWKRPYIWLFFLVPLTFLGYLGYIEWKLGDWQLFFKGVEVWHRNKLVFPLRTLWRYFKILILYADVNFVYWVAWGEALFTALYAGAIAVGWGRVRLSYWVMMVMHLLIPVLTGTLQGMPRYGLHLYPFFLILTMGVLRLPRWGKLLFFATSLLVQALYGSLFLQGYFVA